MSYKNHYQILGIDRDASPADIKNAYREQARFKHPDKGGDHNEFADLSNAYEVLSDPERRMLYDATGKDNPQLSTEDEAKQLLLSLFSEALQNDNDLKAGTIIEKVRKQIINIENNFIEHRLKLNTRKNQLIVRRNKIHSTAETNLIHILIDTELKNIDIAFTELDRKTKVQKILLSMIDTYSEESVFQPMMPQYGRISIDNI